MQVARHHVSHDMPGMGSARGQMGAVPPVNSSNFISIFAGPVLMGFALWRSQSVPRWLAVLFFAGLELAQQLGSIGPVRVVLLTLPFAVAMVLLAARIWRAAALPPSRSPEPAAVPVSTP